MKSGKTKKGIKKVIMIVGGVLLFIGVVVGILYMLLNPYRGTLKNGVISKGLGEVLTKEEVREDIDYAMKTMRERHPAWLEEGNQRVALVEQQYLTELEGLTDSMTVKEVWCAVGRIMHSLEDGHTAVYNNNPESTYIHSLTKLRNINTVENLVAINGEPIEDVIQRFLPIFQYEREEYARAIFFANIIASRDYLEWCDVDVSEGVTFTLREGDELVDEIYHFVPRDEVEGIYSDGNDQWVYYEMDEENHIGIFTLTTCRYDEEYKQTVKQFFEEVSAKEIQDVIVDLRGNGGGSSYVANEFLEYINVDGYYGWGDAVRIRNYLFEEEGSYMKNRKKSPVFEGNLYVLTNLKSYSSAMDFAMLVEDNHIGTLVGEASGNMPNSYGDVLSFALPNSGLNIQVSYKRWHRVDTTKEELPLEPDFPCASQEAMDKAYELILESR